MSDSKKTDFGFSDIPLEEKTPKVHGLFSRVANHYDLMNDLMSLGAHRLWKHSFIQNLPLCPQQNIIDVAGGTGDIAIGILKQFSYLQPHVTVCDLTQTMIDQGRTKALNQGILKIDWVCGNAEDLPFPDNHFDGYTIAFGLRNVTQKDKSFQEAVRVLKPGGWYRCLEFSHPQHTTFQKIYDAYSFAVLPKLGQLVANDRDAYAYLVESIRMFPKQEELCQMMEQAGLTRVKFQNVWDGLVCIHEGTKAP